MEPRSGGASSVPKVRSVLATTDFSELANAALPYAYAVVDDGGTVHLAHVVEMGEPEAIPNPLYAHYTPGRASTPAELAELRDSLAARLDALAPREALERRVHTEVQVLAGPEVAAAVAAAAERVDATLICVGSHGRSGIAKLLLGSTASAILAASRRPVLVVRVDDER